MEAVRTAAAILLLAIATVPSAAFAEQGTLSPHDAQLIAQTGFEREVLDIIREVTRGTLHRLSGYDEDGYQILVNGIVASIPHGKAGQVLTELRGRLAARRYMAFIVEESPTIRMDRIAVLRGTDQYEILRVMYTHADDGDLVPQDIIDTLKGWEKHYPFEIIGAENDWVELEFKDLPKDLGTFVDEVVEFCPDAVDGSPADVTELIKELYTTRRLLLWWE